MNSISHSRKSIGMLAAIVLFILAIASFAFMFDASKARANPSSTCYDQSAGSTTTLAYMSAGAGTTTITIANCLSDVSLTLATAIVDIQYTASTSNPILKMRVEHSRDGKDWYPVSNVLVSNATTSIITGNFSEYQMTFATSTYAGDYGGSGTASTTIGSLPIARLHQSIIIPTPNLYTRVKFYVPTGGGNGGLWASIVGQREVLAR